MARFIRSKVRSLCLSNRVALDGADKPLLIHRCFSLPTLLHHVSLRRHLSRSLRSHLRFLQL